MNEFRKSLFTFLAVLLFPLLAAAEKSPVEPPANIIAGMLAAYGGRDAVAAVKTVVTVGTIIQNMQDQKGSYIRYQDRSGKLRVEVMPELGGEVRVLVGQRGWQGDVEHLGPARPMTLQSMLYQYAYLDLPMAFTESAVKASFGGRQSINGREVDLLLVEVSGAPQLKVAVDRETHLIVRVSSEFGIGKGSELVTEYSEYRPVGKVLFPFRLVSYMGDMKLSETSLDTIRINEEIPKEVFPPEKKN